MSHLAHHDRSHLASEARQVQRNPQVHWRRRLRTPQCKWLRLCRPQLLAALPDHSNEAEQAEEAVAAPASQCHRSAPEEEEEVSDTSFSIPVPGSLLVGLPTQKTWEHHAAGSLRARS